jgi:hypothetical protein
MPERIQLRRTKGWRMPPGTIKVDRSGPWGNPFPIGREGLLGRVAPDAEGAVGFFEAMLDDPEMRAAAGYPDDLSPLRGHDLGCWCEEDARWCHGDVLIKRANL